MKPKFNLLTGVIAASCLTLPGLADDDKKRSESQNPKPTYDQRTDQRHPRSRRAERLGPVAKGNELIGMTVENRQNENIGKIDDFAVDLENGRIVHLIVQSGGFLGVGSKHIAIPPGAFQLNANGKTLQLDATKESLKSAPEFDMSKWNEWGQPNRVGEIYRHYNQDPYFGANVPQDRDGKLEVRDRDLDQSRNTDRDRELQRERERSRNVPAVDTQKRDQAQNPDRERNVTRSVQEDPARNRAFDRSYAQASRLGYVERASKVIGMPVKNAQDEKLGKVDNLIVDVPAGRVVEVVVSSGGFLGMGDTLSVVPPSVFRFTPERDTLQLDATKESLASAPHFKSTEWPDVGNPEYVGRVYQSYRLEPYYDTTLDAGADADNTARNVRDRDPSTLTPINQGTSEADVQTTTRIRKDIIARDGLSVNARNVKVITANGRVTLRGPVNTQEEKQILGEIASRAAAGASVDNQLEVKSAVKRTSSNP